MPVETGCLSLCHCLVLLEKSKLGTRVCHERVGFVRLEDPIQMKSFMKGFNVAAVEEGIDKFFDDARKRSEGFFLSLPSSEIILT